MYSGETYLHQMVSSVYVGICVFGVCVIDILLSVLLKTHGCHETLIQNRTFLVCPSQTLNQIIFPSFMVFSYKSEDHTVHFYFWWCGMNCL